MIVICWHAVICVTSPYMNMWNRHTHTGKQNVHNVHNAHRDNIRIPKHKNTYDFLVLYFGLRSGQKCHSKVMHLKGVTHSNGSYERKSRGRKLADEMGRAKKFLWYTHRLMHRKRVTCELHDSYFCLMTIKHAISKDRVGDWVGLELLYNSVETEFEFQLELESEQDECGR